MTAPGVEPVQMCNSPSWEIQKLIGVKWNFCWRWHFQFMQPHPLEDSWNKSHLEAFMPYFLPVLTKVESLPILIWWVFSGVCILSCCCSVTKLCQTLCDLMDCSTPDFLVLHHLPELAQTHVRWITMPSNHLILCRSLLLLPSVFPNIRVFSNESALHVRWLKFWSFSFSISPSNEYSGLVSFIQNNLVG